ncbi:hypothetical protein FSS13T_17970 [Flavobacterium saliperosum S13]|uniref:Uncharacterized protein n=1 Tax=Flavobacterium saliperosum S13 TaxID=1341155 RepID=A0ABP2ZWA4_9FLAO|nr:hypothetical protein FSS13T_17970 [Flavobacterium saliperosum S13]
MIVEKLFILGKSKLAYKENCKKEISHLKLLGNYQIRFN